MIAGFAGQVQNIYIHPNRSACHEMRASATAGQGGNTAQA